MKRCNIFKILNILILAISLSCCSSIVVVANPKKQQENNVKEKENKLKEVEENIKRVEKSEMEQIKENVKKYKNFKRENYELKDYILKKVYFKYGVPILFYVHKKTKAQIIIVPVKDKQDLNSRTDSMLFRAFLNDDRGLVHFCEHIFASESLIKLKKHFSSAYVLNAFTKEFGLEFAAQANIPNSRKYLEFVCEILKNKDITVDDELFNREKKRIFYEIKDIEKGHNVEHTNNSICNNSFGRGYSVGGISEEVNKVKKEEVVRFYKEIMHPSNLLVVKHMFLKEKNVKEYLKDLDELYLKHFNNKVYKTGKTELKNKKPFRKIKWPYDGEIFKRNEADGTVKKYRRFAKIAYSIEDLNEEYRKLFSLNFGSEDNNNNNKFIKELKDYVKSLGYDDLLIPLPEVHGSSCLGFEFNITLFSNKDGGLFEEKTLKENSNKILLFIKNKLKNMNDVELTQVLSPVSFYTENVNFKQRSFIGLYLGNGLDDIMKKSFSCYGDPFSNKLFNIGKNNEILESRESVVESAKNSLYVYDKLIKKGPKYIDYFVADKDVKYFDKFKFDFLKYNLPIKFKDYNNSKTLFYLASYYLSEYFDVCLGLGNSLTHSGFYAAKYYGGPVSNSEACSESRDAVFKYINKNFDNIIKNFKITRKEFEHLKQIFKEMYVNTLKQLEKSFKKFVNFKKDVEEFLKGEGEGVFKIDKNLTVDQFSRLWLFKADPSNEDIEEYCEYKFDDSLKDYSEDLKRNAKKNELYIKKYKNKSNEKITKEFVKDYFHLQLEVFYNFAYKNLKFYRKLVKELDSIKYEDVIKVIKSAYLLKKEELDEVNNINKLMWKIKKDSLKSKLNKNIVLFF